MQEEEEEEEGILLVRVERAGAVMAASTAAPRRMVLTFMGAGAVGATQRLATAVLDT